MRAGQSIVPPVDLLKLTLVDGTAWYFKPIEGRSGMQELWRFRRGEAPFSAEWLEVEGGAMVRVSAIIRAEVSRDGR